MWVVMGEGRGEEEGSVWCGVVWCGVSQASYGRKWVQAQSHALSMWCGAMWCDVVWWGVALCGVVWCGMGLDWGWEETS